MHIIHTANIQVAGDEIEKLWYEYENASTPEANLVKDFDKVRACCLMDLHTCIHHQWHEAKVSFWGTPFIQQLCALCYLHSCLQMRSSCTSPLLIDFDFTFPPLCICDSNIAATCTCDIFIHVGNDLHRLRWYCKPWSTNKLRRYLFKNFLIQLLANGVQILEKLGLRKYWKGDNNNELCKMPSAL